MNATTFEPIATSMFGDFNNNNNNNNTSNGITPSDIASDDDIRGFLFDLVSKEKQPKQQQQQQQQLQDDINHMVLSDNDDDDDDDAISFEAFKNLLDPDPIIPAVVSIQTTGDNNDRTHNFEDEGPPSSFEGFDAAPIRSKCRSSNSPALSPQQVYSGVHHPQQQQQQQLPDSYGSPVIPPLQQQQIQQQLQHLSLLSASTGGCIPKHAMSSPGITTTSSTPTIANLQQHDMSTAMQFHSQQQHLSSSSHHRRTHQHQHHRHHPYAATVGSGCGSHNLLSNASNHSRTTDTSIEDTAARLNDIMMKSKATQSALQNWDRRNGLPKSHSQTMVNSSRSRKQLQEGVVLAKWDGTPLLDIHGVPLVGARKRPGERSAGSSRRKSPLGGMMGSQSEHHRRRVFHDLPEEHEVMSSHSGHVRSSISRYSGPPTCLSSTASKAKPNMVQSEHIRRFSLLSMAENEDDNDNEPISWFDQPPPPVEEDKTKSKYFMRRFSATD